MSSHKVLDIRFILMSMVSAYHLGSLSHLENLKDYLYIIRRMAINPVYSLIFFFCDCNILIFVSFCLVKYFLFLIARGSLVALVKISHATRLHKWKFPFFFFFWQDLHYCVCMTVIQFCFSLVGKSGIPKLKC